MMTALRAILCIAGLALLWLSLLVYEDEESRIQSRLENYWIRLDELRLRSYATENLFMARLASRFNQVLDSLFGHKLLSTRSVITSISQSIITCFTTLLIFDRFAHVPAPLWVVGFFWGLVAWEFVCIVLARRYVWIALACWVLPFVPTLFYIIFLRKHKGDLAILFGSLLLSLVTDLAVIAVTRLLMRYAAQSKSTFRLIFTGLTVITMLTIVSLLPVFLAISRSLDQHIHPNRRVFYRLSQGMAVLNLSDAFLMLIILVAITLLFMHHMLWPSIQRPLYLMQRTGITASRKVAASIGFTMISMGLGLTPIMKEIKKLVGL